MAGFIMRWSRRGLVAAWCVLPVVLCMSLIPTRMDEPLTYGIRARDGVIAMGVVIPWLIITYVVAWIAGGWGRGGPRRDFPPEPPATPAPPAVPALTRTRLGDAASATLGTERGTPPPMGQRPPETRPLDVRAVQPGDLGMVETKVLVEAMMDRYDVSAVVLGESLPGGMMRSRVMTRNVSDQGAFFDSMAAMVRDKSFKVMGDDLLGN